MLRSSLLSGLYKELVCPDGWCYFPNLQEKKSLQNNPLPNPQKQRVQEEPGMVARETTSSSSPFLNHGWTNEEPWRESIHELIFCVFSGITLKEVSKQDWNQAEKMEMPVWSGRGPSWQQQWFQQNHGSDRLSVPLSLGVSGGAWPRNWPRLLRFSFKVWKALRMSSSGWVQIRSCTALAGCAYLLP